MAFVTFTFALSASQRLLQKFASDRRDAVARGNAFAATELTWPLAEALAAAPVQRVSLARVGGQPYYRLVSQSTDGQPAVQYRSTRTGQPLPYGELRYARELGEEFMTRLQGQATGASEDGALPDCCAPPSYTAETATTVGTPAAGLALAQASLGSPELVTKFAGEYGFVNKRRPVMKLAFAGPGRPCT